MENFFLSCKECLQIHPTSLYGCFYLGPFNNSQSLTVANALRRTLLSEIPGIGIFHLEIDGVPHEYTTVKGLRESVLDVLLNFKQIVLKKPDSLPLNQIMYGYLNARGPGVIRASDLKLPPSIQCVDPNQYIATLNEDGNLQIKFSILELKTSGFPTFFNQNNVLSQLSNLSDVDNLMASAYNNLTESDLLNAEPFSNEKLEPLSSYSQPSNSNNSLFVDPLFNPIHKVNYTIQNYGPLKQNKMNQIVIVELWTNGSIHPRVALYKGLAKLKNLFFQLDQMKLTHSLLLESNIKDKPNYVNMLKNIEYDYATFKNKRKNLLNQGLFDSNVSSLYNHSMDPTNIKIGTTSSVEEKVSASIDYLGLPDRISKCLTNNNIYTIKDLLQFSSGQLLRLPGFGHHCLIVLEINLKKNGFELH